MKAAQIGRRLAAVPFAVWLLLPGCLALQRFTVAWRQAPSYAANPDYDAQDRTKYWLESAATFQQTGIPLAIKAPSGAVYPIEDYSLADDRGHAVLACLAAKFKSGPVNGTDLTRINLLINILGLSVMGAALIAGGYRLAALLYLTTAVWKAVPGPIPGIDVFSAYIGIINLALAPMVWVASLKGDAPLGRRAAVAGGLLSLSLCAAYVLRQPHGLIGVATLGGAVLWQLWRRRSERIVWRLALVALAFGAVLPMSATPLLLRARTTLYGLPEARSIQSHGVSHTLLHGLGTEPNPWGIEWADTYGLNLVRRIAPGVEYASDAYYKLMRGLYFRLLWENPAAVARIYSVKLGKALALPFRVWGVNVFHLGFAIALGLPFLWLRAADDERPVLAALVGMSAALFLFLAQGVIGIPWGKHLYPAKILVMLELSLAAQFVIAAAIKGTGGRA